MREANDDSVQVAIDELWRLEDERQRSLAAAKVAEEAAERAARDAERAREDHGARVAEVEARLRVEAEERARREDADRRIAALRAELDAVRRDREHLHALVRSRGASAALGTRAEAVEPSLRSLGRRSVLVASMVGAAALFGFAVARSIGDAEVPPVVAVDPVVIAELAPAGPVDVAAQTAAEAPTEVAAAGPIEDAPRPRGPRARARGRGGANARAASAPASMSEADRMLRDLDACERRGGLLCGTE